MFKKKTPNLCVNTKKEKLCVNVKKQKLIFLNLKKIGSYFLGLAGELGFVSFFCLLVLNDHAFAKVDSLLAVEKNNSEVDLSNAGSVFNSHFMTNLGFKINSPEWENINATKLILLPQSTVLLNDKMANAILKINDSREISLKSIYNKNQLWLRMEWTDETLNQVSSQETASFGDSIAVEIPKEFSDRLPYVGMGDEVKNVFIYMQRAGEQKTFFNEYVSAGFGSLTRTPKNISIMQMNYLKSEKKWQALLNLPLHQRNMKQNLLPLAFALWDGESLERGANKYLSAWHFLKMDHFAKNKKFIEQVTFQYSQNADLEKGKAIFNSVCVSCHKVGGLGVAKDAIAPNLKFIGALSTQAYLRDSLIEPNQVIVRHLNINRHYNKTDTPGRNRAYPANDLYRWYFLNEKGERISKMPSFKSMDEQDIQNLVAYLKTL